MNNKNVNLIANLYKILQLCSCVVCHLIVRDNAVILAVNVHLYLCRGNSDYNALNDVTCC